jgi:hypothetical protein
MKTITLHVDEATYSAFQEEAARTGRPTSELIRDAMSSYYRSEIARPSSIFAQEGADAGEVLRDLSADDDLLDEMLG